MKERESFFAVLKDGTTYNHPDAEVTRTDDVLVVYGDDDHVYRFNWDFVAMYNVGPVEVKNLDD